MLIMFIILTRYWYYLQVTIVRHVQKKFPKVDKKFQAEAESLAARG